MKQDDVYFDTLYCQSQQSMNCKTQFTDIVDGIKANYGFNAMYRKGVPEGSVSFGFDGGYFRFHSETKGQDLKFLEVNDGIRARWMGTGMLSTVKDPKKNSYDNDFCYMVAVNDWGEPGYKDTWRIRVWYCGETDNKGDLPNGLPPVDSPSDCSKYGDNDHLGIGTPKTHPFLKCADDMARLVFDTHMHGELPSAGFSGLPKTSELLRFNGTEVGELGDQKGGGNIQIHLNGKPTAALEEIIKAGETPECCAVEFEGDGCIGFVTGGGQIHMGSPYLKEPFPASKQDECSCDLAHGICDSDKANENCNLLESGQIATFGFNAKQFHGVPDGSTNFLVHDVGGKDFHFHTEKYHVTDGKAHVYDGLEVVCDDDTYGTDGAYAGVSARWTGVGKIQYVGSGEKPDEGKWVSGYRFFVAVQDWGEPGRDDTFRIRVLDKDGESVLFDSNHELGAQDDGWIYKELDPLCTDPADCSGTPQFDGDDLGRNPGKNGGGNIQMHCKGGPVKPTDGTCKAWIPGGLGQSALVLPDEAEEATSTSEAATTPAATTTTTTQAATTTTTTTQAATTTTTQAATTTTQAATTRPAGCPVCTGGVTNYWLKTASANSWESSPGEGHCLFYTGDLTKTGALSGQTFTGNHDTYYKVDFTGTNCWIQESVWKGGRDTCKKGEIKDSCDQVVEFTGDGKPDISHVEILLTCCGGTDNYDPQWLTDGMNGSGLYGPGATGASSSGSEEEATPQAATAGATAAPKLSAGSVCSYDADCQSNNCKCRGKNGCTCQ